MKECYKTKDYTDLEGKKITWINENGIPFKAKAANVDYDVGITIVADQDIRYCDYEEESKDNSVICGVGGELTCLNGSMSPNETTHHYDTFFLYTIAKIRRGTYDSRISDIIHAKYDVTLWGGMRCAFK